MTVILLGEGFEETEAVAPYDLLKRAGVDVRFVGVGGDVITGSHGIRIVSELPLSQLDAENIEMLVLPGGLRGVQTLAANEQATALTKKLWDVDKYIAAICAAPTILAQLGITDGKQATCYPGMEDRMGSAKMQAASAVTDGRLITGRAAGSAFDFGLALVTALKGAEAAQKVAADVVYG